MLVATPGEGDLTRYYIGGRYEIEEDGENGMTTENLYLGGDAYTAPMVLQRKGSLNWIPYVIGRDHLGSITHIAATNGTKMAEYSYDAWGRMRNPSTFTVYSASAQPKLFLGRGWCGHEHLQDFGLVNMNARLYDPVLGRFLSPDPYVQAPDLPANFNRYAYCLNNPLKYTDPNGEIWFIPVIIGAAIGAYAGASLQSGTLNFTQWSNDAWKGAISGAIIGGAFGFIIGSATGATGLLAADGSVTKVAGVVSSSLFDGSMNICFNAISGGTWDSAWKSGVSGLLVGAWSASGGLGMVSGFGAESKLGQLAGKLGYQTISTSLSSIGNNWANNRPLLSQMDIGIGPITFSFGSGPLFQLRKNLPAIVMNGLGVGNLLFGGHANFDWSNLSMQYSGGLVDTFFPPADGASGFGAYAIIGNSNLTKTYPTLGYRSIYEHELHHLWHSRSLGDKYIPDYLLHSLTAICLGGAPISVKNYFESIAYGYWWF